MAAAARPCKVVSPAMDLSATAAKYRLAHAHYAPLNIDRVQIWVSEDMGTASGVVSLGIFGDADYIYETTLATTMTSATVLTVERTQLTRNQIAKGQSLVATWTAKSGAGIAYFGADVAYADGSNEHP